MNKQIFLNLPVADVAKSKAFYQALGYSFNPQFTGDEAACVIISESIFVMLGTADKIRQFTPKTLCNPRKEVSVVISLSCESRQEVDDLVAKALANGGSTDDKAEDLGFMYSHSFLDLDGHGWGVFFMPAPPPQA